MCAFFDPLSLWEKLKKKIKKITDMLKEKGPAFPPWERNPRRGRWVHTCPIERSICNKTEFSAFNKALKKEWIVEERKFNGWKELSPSQTGSETFVFCLLSKQQNFIPIFIFYRLLDISNDDISGTTYLNLWTRCSPLGQNVTIQSWNRLVIYLLFYKNIQ